MSDIPLPPSLAGELDRVDAIIAERIRLRREVEQIAAPHALRPRTSRIRAALVLLCARLGAYDGEATAHAAAAVELIHAAALLHDDLIDPAAQRGRAPQGDGWAQNIALMVGDYLFALAASEMALSPDARIIAYYSQAVMAICEGQLAPVRAASSPDLARQQYEYAVARKVASLYQAACQAGGVCAGLAQPAVDALARFGHALGMALALRADALDYRTSAGHALRSGAITLPLIYAVEAGGLQPDLFAEEWPPASSAQPALLTTVQQLGADIRALSDAGRYAEQALAELSLLPAGPPRDELEAIARGCGHGCRRYGGQDD